ncbi:uncharacterized protein [Amphiura filiformis]|uniref:uncharacterized protein isoform X2 n=1 Tax=Amphiura filiformis TaxID=82378 RepID=UPI003B223C29
MTKNGKTKVASRSPDKFNKSGSFDADLDLPPTPPEEWETSGDRLGGKLYVAVKNFKARYPYEINIKMGEMVELTEIDPDDKSWHVRVTLGTNLDGFTYTKRVGWVPYNVFSDYKGPDRRNSEDLIDVSQETCPLPGTDMCPLPESDSCPVPGTDHAHMSRSLSDVTKTCETLAELDMTGKSSSVHSSGGYNIQRSTGSWLGGSSIHHHLGHKFQASSLHVPIKCSFCKKWCSFQNQEECEYQCLNCKLVVHKGCHVKILNRCRLDSTEEEAYCPVFNESAERLCIDLPHRFLVHTWKVPPRCSHCSGFVIGMVRQGLKCAECGTNIHHKCKPNVANTCSTKYKEIADHVYEVKA